MKLNISEDDNSLDLQLAMEVHEFFRLTHAEATATIQRVKMATRKGSDVAKAYQISKAEQELKAPAYQAN